MTRNYEPDDLESSELVAIAGLHDQELKCSGKRDLEGRLLLQAKSAARLADFGEVNHSIIVSPAGRKLLEKQSFDALSFNEVRVENTVSGQNRALFWELDASVVLPKLANTNKLKCYGTGPTGKVEPFTGDYSRMVFIEDPPFAGGEIHYLHRELTSLGRFDIAMTFEHLWIPQRSLIVSQRFYQHCLKHKIPLEVEPVRIDPN